MHCQRQIEKNLIIIAFIIVAIVSELLTVLGYKGNTESRKQSLFSFIHNQQWTNVYRGFDEIMSDERTIKIGK